MQELTPEIAQQLNLPAGTHGVVVTSGSSSPAAATGLNRGDVIQEVNHKPVHNVDEYNQAMASSGKKPVLLLVNHGGRTGSSWSSQRSNARLTSHFRGHGYQQPCPRFLSYSCLVRNSFSPPLCWWFSDAVLDDFMYSECRPIPASCQAHAMPRTSCLEFDIFSSQRILCNRIALVGV